MKYSMFTTRGNCTASNKTIDEIITLYSGREEVQPGRFYVTDELGERCTLASLVSIVETDTSDFVYKPKTTMFNTGKKKK